MPTGQNKRQVILQTDLNKIQPPTDEELATTTKALEALRRLLKTLDSYFADAGMPLMLVFDCAHAKNILKAFKNIAIKTLEREHDDT